MAYLIAALLTLLSLLVISYPFLKPRLQPPTGSPSEELEGLERELRSLLDEMDRLQLDLEAGNLAQEEHDRQAQGLRRAAAANLRAQKPLQARADAEEELSASLEEEIRARRLARRQEDDRPQ